MPVTYSVDPSRGVVLEVWTGDVTASEVKALWEKYLADPQVMAIRKTLADLRQAHLRLTGLQLMELIEQVAVPGLHGLDWTTAIVVARPDQYGFSRQFQVFAEVFNENSIFQDYDTALAWLLVQ